MIEFAIPPRYSPQYMTSGPKQHKAARPERFRLDVQLSAAVLGPSGATEVLQGRTTDISLGGIGIVLSGELAAGQVVDLAFTPPDKEAVALRAVVRHRKGFRYGLDFLSLDAITRARIARLCQ